jgi:hypothetical protein
MAIVSSECSSFNAVISASRELLSKTLSTETTMLSSEGVSPFSYPAYYHQQCCRKKIPWLPLRVASPTLCSPRVVGCCLRCWQHDRSRSPSRALEPGVVISVTGELLKDRSSTERPIMTTEGVEFELTIPVTGKLLCDKAQTGMPEILIESTAYAIGDLRGY